MIKKKKLWGEKKKLFFQLWKAMEVWGVQTVFNDRRTAGNFSGQHIW